MINKTFDGRIVSRVLRDELNRYYTLSLTRNDVFHRKWGKFIWKNIKE